MQWKNTLWYSTRASFREFRAFRPSVKKKRLQFPANAFLEIEMLLIHADVVDQQVIILRGAADVCSR